MKGTYGPRQFLAGIYFILCIGHLILELVYGSFESGLEAVITMGNHSDRYLSFVDCHDEKVRSMNYDR